MVKKFLSTNPPPCAHSITLNLVLHPGGPFIVGLAFHLKGIFLGLDVDGDDILILLCLADCSDVPFENMSFGVRFYFLFDILPGLKA